jgi:hypothetical protein
VPFQHRRQTACSLLVESVVVGGGELHTPVPSPALNPLSRTIEKSAYKLVILSGNMVLELSLPNSLVLFILLGLTQENGSTLVINTATKDYYFKISYVILILPLKLPLASTSLNMLIAYYGMNIPIPNATLFQNKYQIEILQQQTDTRSRFS